MFADPAIPHLLFVRPFVPALSIAGLVAILAVSAALLRGSGDRPAPAQPLVREVAKGELVHRAGRMHRGDEAAPFTGVATDTWADGTPRSRLAYREGRLHGLVEGWHTNGVLQVREHFEDGVSHGLRSKFFPDGKPLSETPIVHGQVRGTFRRWHDNGRLAEEIPMEDGQPHGTSRAYYPSGTLKAEARTDHGKVLEHRVWKEGEAPADLAASAR